MLSKNISKEIEEMVTTSYEKERALQSAAIG
jgi:hypothetical protein